MATPIVDPHPMFRSRPQSLAILGAAVGFSIWALLTLYQPQEAASAVAQTGGKDLQAYRRIVERVHHGDNYYSAAAQELREGGYASSSVFNWRLPTYAWLLAAFPRPEWGQALLGLLALTALALAYTAERKNATFVRAAALVLAMAGAFLWCIDGDAFFSQELWAGVLIALSVGAFGVDMPRLGVASGLAALFLRELALPYVMVALVLAAHQKRWRETAAWSVGLLAFAVYFAWHAWQVHGHLTGSEFAESEGWLQFGGPAFVIRTCQMNAWLFNLPGWLALLWLVASLVGFATWRGPVALRVTATVWVYLLAFLIVGKPFNAYWGLLFVALLPLGLIRVPTRVLGLTRQMQPVPGSQ